MAVDRVGATGGGSSRSRGIFSGRAASSASAVGQANAQKDTSKPLIPTLQSHPFNRYLTAQMPNRSKRFTLRHFDLLNQVMVEQQNMEHVNPTMLVLPSGSPPHPAHPPGVGGVRAPRVTPALHLLHAAGQ